MLAKNLFFKNQKRKILSFLTKSKLITKLTFWKSIPRPINSVQINKSIEPERNLSTTNWHYLKRVEKSFYKKIKKKQS